MVFSLYISLVFSFSCINRQLSFFVLSLLVSTICSHGYDVEGSIGRRGGEESQPIVSMSQNRKKEVCLKAT